MLKQKELVMDSQQIAQQIAFGNWTNEDISSFVESIKYARSRLTKTVRASIRTGDNVEFTNKTGRVVRGFVKKVAIKYITVDTGMGLWRVPANMLRIVD
jgi:hypothetical protein